MEQFFTLRIQKFSVNVLFYDFHYPLKVYTVMTFKNNTDDDIRNVWDSYDYI